jgi:hypothetical protein
LNVHTCSSPNDPSSATAGTAGVERRVGVELAEALNGPRPRRFAAAPC